MVQNFPLLMASRHLSTLLTCIGGTEHMVMPLRPSRGDQHLFLCRVIKRIYFLKPHLTLTYAVKSQSRCKVAICTGTCSPSCNSSFLLNPHCWQCIHNTVNGSHNSLAKVHLPKAFQLSLKPANWKKNM